MLFKVGAAVLLFSRAVSAQCDGEFAIYSYSDEACAKDEVLDGSTYSFFKSAVGVCTKETLFETGKFVKVSCDDTSLSAPLYDDEKCSSDPMPF